MVMQLRDAIHASGRSLNQLSKECGVDRSRLSRFVRGERNISFEAAMRICEALGITKIPGRFSPPAREPEPPAPPVRRPGKKK
jgi:transcriptional regulator with XRE-family HTH domain